MIDAATIQALMSDFESRKVMEGDEEFWSARDLQHLLGYKEWRSFTKAISRAKTNAEKAGVDPDINFVEATKFSMLSYGERTLDDIKLTRSGAYLVALNADPSNENVAFAKVYFAAQTRRMELVQQALIDWDERLATRSKLVDSEKELGQVLWERGVDGRGIGIVRSEGDRALFGIPTRDMKTKLGVKSRKPLADVLPTVAIKAKELAAAMTSHNAKGKDLFGLSPLRFEHSKNNSNVRQALLASEIIPEELEPAEDTAPAMRKIKQKMKALGGADQPSLGIGTDDE